MTITHTDTEVYQMTTAPLALRAAEPAGPKCPVWCTNHTHPRAAERDMCDAGSGHRDHFGRIGCVVLPSRVDAYYDEEIGVELYRYEGDGGEVTQLSVLIIYSCEMEEIGHVTLSIDEARQLANLTRLDSRPRAGGHSRTRFGDRVDNNILVEHPTGAMCPQVVMVIGDREIRASLHRSQLQSLGELAACASVLAEVTQ